MKTFKRFSSEKLNEILDSIDKKDETEDLSEDEMLALMIWSGYSDWNDMNDLDSD